MTFAAPLYDSSRTLVGVWVNFMDLSLIDAPAYIYASREDHIVPWTAAYASVPLFKGPRQFVLGASGHIAGVINPPAANRRCYWTGSDTSFPKDAEQWIGKAKEHAGSWWPDWDAWMKRNSNGTIAAPSQQGNGRFRPIEPAPGRYVKEKAN